MKLEQLILLLGKHEISESDIDSSEDEQSSDREFDEIVELDEGEEFGEFDDNDDDDDDNANGDEVTDQLLKTWKGVKPRNKDENLLGKSYAVVYSGKRSKILFIGKLDQRFVVGADYEVDKLLITCLKPKVGLGTILEDTSKHLPPDQRMFDP